MMADNLQTQHGMYRAGLLVFAVVLLGGCPADGVKPDGGTPPDGNGDASESGMGLAFLFHSEPSLADGGEVGGDFDAAIEAARFALEDVRAIGDAAPGDDRTSTPEFVLDWDREDDGESLHFPQAPPGMYSQLLGEVVSYQLVGTVTVEDMEKPFLIVETTTSIEFALGLDELQLEPRMGVEIPVEVELDEIVREIRWSDVPEDGEGVLRVDETAPEIDSVRESIAESFTGESSN